MFGGENMKYKILKPLTYKREILVDGEKELILSQQAIKNLTNSGVISVVPNATTNNNINTLTNNQTAYNSMEMAEIKRLADSLKIKYPHNIKKSTLINKIKEVKKHD